MSRAEILGFLVYLALLPCISFAGGKKDEAAALVEHAKQLSDIRAEGAPAFVLKAEFRLLRDPDHPITGSYTEIWASRSLSRTEISAQDFKKTEVINDRKRWELSSASETPKDIGSAVSTVAYRLDHLSLDSRGPAKILDRVNGSWALRCMVGHDDGIGGRQELCFDKSGGQFVAQSAPFISQGGELVSKCAFTDFQKFGDKLFPTSIQCAEGEKQILVAGVVQLTRLEPDESSFAALPGAQEFPNCPVELKHAEVIESSDPDRVSGGPVVLSLLVGTDGKPHDLKVATSARAEMDNAALEAVRRWRFKPASCEGQPMESRIDVIVTSHTGGY